MAAAAGLIGQGIESGVNVHLAKEQRKWLERMSNTAYQRSMKDMRRAGLNPILAYKTGGASTPGMQAPQINLPGVSDASSALVASRQAGLIRQQEATSAQQAATIELDRTTSAPGKHLEALKNKILLKGATSAIGTAKEASSHPFIRKELKIGPDSGPMEIYNQLRKYYTPQKTDRPKRRY